MTVPCLSNSNGIRLEIDPTTGRLTATLVLAANSGLVVSGTGLAVDLAQTVGNGGGLALTAGGLSVSTRVEVVGWVPGANDSVSPNQAVGANAYVQVGGVLSHPVSRRVAGLNQYVEIDYGCEVTVAVSDSVNSNQFWGWHVAIERRDNGGAWVEVASAGMSGKDNAATHSLHYSEAYLLDDAATHTIDLRLTCRGGSAGTVIVKNYQKKYSKARYL
jgi:hypothetical protein